MTAVDLINKLGQSKANIYITALTPQGASTFGADNREHFPDWALLQMAKINNPDRQHSLTLVIREFTSLTDPATGLPIKRIGGCFIDRTGVYPVSKQAMRQAHHTDADTGKKIKPEPAVTFIGFDELVSRL